MKTLTKNDFVIYDKANDQVLQFEKSGDIVIFGSKNEAFEDCKGNEYVILAKNLPQKHLNKILTQINN